MITNKTMLLKISIIVIVLIAVGLVLISRWQSLYGRYRVKNIDETIMVVRGIHEDILSEDLKIKTIDRIRTYGDLVISSGRPCEFVFSSGMSGTVK